MTLPASFVKIGLAALLVSGCSRVPIAADRSALASAPPPVPASAPALTPACELAPASGPASTPTLASAPTPTPASTSATAPSDPPVRPATALRVDRLVMARGVVDREPQGTDTLFASNEKRVFAFLEIANPEHAPGDVKLQFVAPDGTPRPAVDVTVGPGARWRTWAFTRQAHTPGTWKAIVRDGRGHTLASTEFDVRG